MSPAEPLATLLSAALERALGGLLALDPAAAETLTAFRGRSLELELVPPGLRLRLTVGDDGLRVAPGAGDGDLVLRASPGALLRRLLGEEGGVGRIEIRGDLELARRLERWIGEFEPELEAPLAAFLGDVLAHRLARRLREGLAEAGRQMRAIGEDLREAVFDPEGVAVPRPEVEGFYEEIAALRDAVERLEARLGRIAATLEGAAKQR